jgi:predicted metal-binding protein
MLDETAEAIGGAPRAPDDARAPVIITICTSCRPAGVPREEAPGRALLAAVTAAAAGHAGVQVRPTQCLSVCTRVCSATLSGEGRYTFVYGDLDTAHAEAIVAMALAGATAPHGFVPWKDRPEPLRKGLLARVPPPGWSPEDGGTPA